MRWAEVGSEPSPRWASLSVPGSPENRFPVWPSSRCCLAWCSRHRPPSVAAFSSAALRYGRPPASRPTPRLILAPHRSKSARCSSALVLYPVGASPALADRRCSLAPCSWPLLIFAIAVSPTPPAHSPAAFAAPVALGHALVWPSDSPLRSADRPSPPRAAAPAPGALGSFLRRDNFVRSPAP